MPHRGLASQRLARQVLRGDELHRAKGDVDFDRDRRRGSRDVSRSLHKRLDVVGDVRIRVAVDDRSAAAFASRLRHQRHDHEAAAELDDAEHQHGENRQHQRHFHGDGSATSLIPPFFPTTIHDVPLLPDIPIPPTRVHTKRRSEAAKVKQHEE